jgi:glycosyltransferase involved in cell wall biosynthesis
MQHTTARRSVTVLMVGSFPPPVHGMTEVNAVIQHHLEVIGAKLSVVNLSPGVMGNAVATKLRKLPKVIGGLWKLAISTELQGKVLYVGLSGGLGLAYEIMFLLLGRFRGMRVYLHHHSFAYLDRMNFLAGAAITLAGRSSTHIVQCAEMAARLNARYPGAERITAISNVALLRDDGADRVTERRCVSTIGFLSNICEEKGVFDFLDLVDVLEVDGVNLKAVLAGPFQDRKTARRVLERVRSMRGLEYVGARYGKEKGDFFASIDVLIFPTKYRNETESRVIPEALREGVPVIAYGRGCIRELVGEGCGRVVSPEKVFVDAAVDKIKEWRAFPELYQSASRCARERYREIDSEHSARLKSLIRDMVG